MKYNDKSRFTATVLDEQGNILPDENVTFNINGVFYNRTSDSNGVASLNINLEPGEYIITSSWDDFKIANTIRVNL